MLPQDQQKLDKLYQSMVKALKRQGMSDVTIDTYSRAVTRIAHFFGRCPDELGKQDLKDYFDHFVTIRSWSTVRAAFTAPGNQCNTCMSNARCGRNDRSMPRLRAL